MPDIIQVTKNKGVALISMNDVTTMNAITDPFVLESVIAAFEEVQIDDSVRVCVLTGVDKAFSSGGNVKDMLSRVKMFAGAPLELSLIHI